MDTIHIKYTINPETRRKIKVGTLIYRRMTVKYYLIDGAFTDQIIPDLRALKVKEDKAGKARK